MGAGGTGNDAELHFGLADFGGRHGDAVVACHGGFESSAKGGAVDGHSDGLGGIFNDEKNLGEANGSVLFSAGNLAELFNVGTGDKSASAADEHDGLNGGVGIEFDNGGGDALGNSRAERIDGRVVNRYDANFAIAAADDKGGGSL